MRSVAACIELVHSSVSDFVIACFPSLAKSVSEVSSDDISVNGR